MRLGEWSLVGALVFAAVGCGVTSPTSQSAAIAPPAPSATNSVSDQVNQIINSAHDTVKSDDGRAELLLPPGSLPAGTPLSDIKIVAVNPASASLRFDGSPPLFDYELQPDGLQFATKPILRLSVELPPTSELPLLFTDSGGSVSRLRPIATEVDLVNRRVTYTAHLAHFSQVEGRGGFFTVTLSELQDHVWGDPFQMKAAIAEAAQSKITITRRDGSKAEVRPTGQVWIEGRWIADQLKPIEVYPAPPVTALRTNTFTLLQSFQCRGTFGPDSVEYDAWLLYTIAPVGSEDVVSGGDKWEEVVVTSDQHRCMPPVGPIAAAFDQSQFMTTYTVEVKQVPALGKGLWDGPNCGTIETLPDRLIPDGKKVLTFVWHHPHPPCGPTPNHTDVNVRIVLPVVQPPGLDWSCLYNGAASGTGDKCKFFLGF